MSGKDWKAKELEEAHQKGQVSGSLGHTRTWSKPVRLGDSEHDQAVNEAWEAGYDNGAKNPKK